MKSPNQFRFILFIITSAFGILAFRPSTNCTIQGTVTDKISNKPLPSVSVTLTANGKKVSQATSDAKGNFCFSNIADGTYGVTASCTGYNTANIKSYTVKNNTGALLKIEMKLAVKTVKELTQKEFSNGLIGTNEKLAETYTINTNMQRACKTATGGTYSYSYYAAPAAKSKSNSYKWDTAQLPYNNADIEEYPKQADKNVSDDAFNTEEYERITENEFQKPSDKPLSTFSIDVDVASYGILRAKLHGGQKPPKESVRLEEMVNYFTYNYPEPSAGKPFSVNTEVGECPWNTNHLLMEVGIQGKRIQKSNLPPSNLVFLIDVSGSMFEPAKLPLVKQSLRMLVNELGEKDRIAIVVYAGNSGLVLPSTPASQKEKIIETLDRLEAGGSTAGAAGIKQAYKVAKENLIANGNNRVILCTDGDFNVGPSSDAELISLIEEKREEGIFLSVLGFGMGNYKDSKMEKLADKGNGNYAYIDNLAEAKKNLVTQMGSTLLTIAKDVKIQVEFNPNIVKAYRLIGYENRALADKDFNDDKKDAGEIGAGASVTALYEIITDANDSDFKQIPSVDALKYQPKQVSPSPQNTGEMLTVKVRYKEPAENTSKLLEYPVKYSVKKLDQTSDNFRFASSVASFGMLIRNSKFKGNYNFDKVLQLAGGAKGKDSEGYRTEFISLVAAAKVL